MVTSFRTSDFYSAIYKVTIPDNTEINFDDEEVKAVIWYDLSDLNEELKNTPEKFTPAFREAWSILADKIVNAWELQLEIYPNKVNLHAFGILYQCQNL